jgi:hypothetical protein
MTARELIEALSAEPPETRVLVDGYEEGYDDCQVTVEIVLRHPTSWWAGDYEDYEGGERVLVLARQKGQSND